MESLKRHTSNKEAGKNACDLTEHSNGFFPSASMYFMSVHNANSCITQWCKAQFLLYGYDVPAIL